MGGGAVSYERGGHVAMPVLAHIPISRPRPAMRVQGCLTYKKTHPPRTLLEAYT